MMLYEGVIVPTALYGAKVWGIERSREEEVGCF